MVTIFILFVSTHRMALGLPFHCIQMEAYTIFDFEAWRVFKLGLVMMDRYYLKLGCY